ncbi:DinB superfamily protein [Marmoricola sp. Leaf446]|uniref:DinB family protein n=1 Tax=Marmoricola sp. Leaf446 TaxID=1736379 RepID=UPI0006FDB97E|nr:DinB family protein [Marmoricola sp. Leaf446]KQT94255.1 DinB superfamily protein [Marmoricola sp. Leaf446]
MTSTPAPDRPRRFVDADLRGARFVRADLSGAVMRAVEVDGADIDAPWLADGSLLVNGVDVAAHVEGELCRRFPGRERRTAEDPEGLRSAWSAVEDAWDAVLARVAAMPAGTPDVSVDGEWSFAQTLRHLVMATDTWLGRGVLGLEQPYHPIGVPNAEYATDGYDTAVFSTPSPSYAEVLVVRRERQQQVRDLLATTTEQQLAASVRHPWNPASEVSVRACLHVVLREEWDHQRFAVRDLDAIEARRGPTTRP